MFEKIAKQPDFRFLGNVQVGRDLSHDELVELYDGVVYAVGAQTDRRMGIPGEDLPGSWPATAFVAWYNGHPDFQDLAFDLSCDRAVVIGNGNVAVDVARMLALAESELAPTDATDAAIEAILASPIREILMLGRRGPAQAAFTTPELKELGELADADIAVDAAELELDPASEAALSDSSSSVARNLELLREYAGRSPEGKRRTLRLRFCCSPVAILGHGRVEAVEIVRNVLVADERGRVTAVATEEREVIPCGLVLRSVGYRGIPLPGVPFDDERATIRNSEGRVLDGDGARSVASTAPGGSSAARAGSSERTRRTPPRRWTLCLPMHEQECSVARQSRAPRLSMRFLPLATSRSSSTTAGRPSTRTSPGAESRTGGRG